MRRFLARGLLLWILLPLPLLAAECPRIVSQAPYITQTLQWLELEPCIVGVSRYDRLERPQTGGVLDPDPEALALLEPELLLNADWIEQSAWERVAPPGARAVRLHGFQSMAQIEANLETVARLAGLPNPKSFREDFAVRWRHRAGEVDGGGRTALLLSACSGVPYSFGRKTWLFELFNAAGFRVVETAETIRHFDSGEAVASLVETLRPELLFLFQPRDARQCQLVGSEFGARIITLDGEKFLHPAPVLLEGLEALRAQRARWAVRGALR